MFMNFEFDTIYYAYLNESPFKYYISILGGIGGHAYFVYLGGVQNSGKPAYIILARSLNACKKELESNTPKCDF